MALDFEYINPKSLNFCLCEKKNLDKKQRRSNMQLTHLDI